MIPPPLLFGLCELWNGGCNFGGLYGSSEGFWEFFLEGELEKFEEDVVLKDKGEGKMHGGGHVDSILQVVCERGLQDFGDSFLEESSFKESQEASLAGGGGIACDAIHLVAPPALPSFAL